ncbi:hypothetical protein HYFRA_00012919 [Hymenoscyphus fraxineus]|uniref:C2H2-type domain-containing protein n=1 Tax=Hymenoscyphus fraxineus TaxID=746836 RepID=A0A9N9L7G2_9HELO|nr:hypothetical protein HYFRA_00012919 [Hymenoscyphus fraxineus]
MMDESNQQSLHIGDLIDQVRPDFNWDDLRLEGDDLDPWLPVPFCTNPPAAAKHDITHFCDLERFVEGNRPLLLGSDSKENRPLETLRMKDSRDKVTKERRPKRRLPCDHPGCTQTFPRPYELDRHRQNFHQRHSIWLCPVYDCRRAANPLPRTDKLWEHYRKEHGDADQFHCFFKDCRAGPFAKDELKDHLNQQQRKQSHRESYLEVILKALKVFGWRQTPIGYGNYLIEDIDTCPLAFLGCAHRGSPPQMFHLKTHDLRERSRGYLAIVKASKMGSWSWRGKMTCPCCDWAQTAVVESFLCHLREEHSDDQISAMMMTLSETLAPWLSGKEAIYASQQDFIEKLRTYLSEDEKENIRGIMEEVTYNDSGS